MLSFLLWLLLCCVMEGYLTSVAYCVISWRGGAEVLALRLRRRWGWLFVDEGGVCSCGLCVEVTQCRRGIFRSLYHLYCRGSYAHGTYHRHLHLPIEVHICQYHSTQYASSMITTDLEDITNPLLFNVILQTAEPYHYISIGPLYNVDDRVTWIYPVYTEWLLHTTNSYKPHRLQKAAPSDALVSTLIPQHHPATASSWYDTVCNASEIPLYHTA
jgi:hypothetical protein